MSTITLKRRPTTATTSPPARRRSRVRWRDLRLWLGVGLMITAMIAGARLLSGGDDTTTVWRATRDLPAGSIPIAEPVEVSLGSASGNYLSASESLEGRLRYPVALGALIPIDATGAPARQGIRLVTLPVDPQHAPVGLMAGDLVDVWATGIDGTNTITEPPALILPAALVAEVDSENLGIGGEVAVVLEVPEDRADDLVLSTRTRVIDLVAVPMSALGDPMPASGDPMPASGDPMPASGDPMPASGDPMPASGDPISAGGNGGVA